MLCRVRPPIREDGTGSQADVVVTYDPDDDGLIYVSNKGRIQTFEFDKVFSASSSQVQVKKREQLWWVILLRVSTQARFTN